ncbi:MAG TPA: sensor domain-containing protein [Solirubrobacteraceae bacterium]
MNEMTTETLDMHTAPLRGEGRTGLAQAASIARGLLRGAGRDLAYLLASFAMSIVAFWVWVATLSATLSLLVFVVGLLVWLASTYVYRWTTWVDRLLIGWVREQRVPAVYRRRSDRHPLTLLRCVTGDLQTWKDLAWLVISSTIGFVLCLAALICTALVIGYILTPLLWLSISHSTAQGFLWWSAHPHEHNVRFTVGLYRVHSLGVALLTTGLGLLLMPLAILLNRGVAWLHSTLGALFLGPSEGQRLETRVQDLTASRAGAVQEAQARLERIERDLHDGAQARLVALAMDLGLAEEQWESDPAAAIDAVRGAREQALAALGELRDLSRGLRPALLEERGLLAAVEGLVARSAQPVRLRCIGSLDGLPESVQTAAYFVVAEALANAGKHAGARLVYVLFVRYSERLSIRVEDDGRGGADEDGSGLEGLRKRVGALDGKFELLSPEGGPTVLLVELQCA